MSQTVSTTGGLAMTGEEWKTSPSFQKTGVVRASLARSRSSPSAPPVQEAALVLRPGPPQSSRSKSITSQPRTKWMTWVAHAVVGSVLVTLTSVRRVVHHAVSMFMYGFSVATLAVVRSTLAPPIQVKILRAPAPW